jgi:hypothetical protein
MALVSNSYTLYKDLKAPSSIRLLKIERLSFPILASGSRSPRRLKRSPLALVQGPVYYSRGLTYSAWLGFAQIQLKLKQQLLRSKDRNRKYFY